MTTATLADSPVTTPTRTHAGARAVLDRRARRANRRAGGAPPCRHLRAPVAVCASSTSAPGGATASPRARIGCTGARASPWAPPARRSASPTRWRRFPRVSATMQRGAISYAKVRALTRIATPDNEAALLDFAQAGTAAHVERLVGAWRRVDQVAAAKAEARQLHRHLSTWVDDDGMVVIRGRLTPEVGAVVQRALEAATDRLRREAKEVPKADRLAEEVTPAQRRADALGLLAEAALTSDLDRGSAGDRYQVVLHVDAPTGMAAGEGLEWPAGDGLSGALEVDHGAVDVSAETSRRLACDAAVVRMAHGADGAVLDVGRKTRTVPPSIRRALQARDHTCRFPGCTARRCDAHHVEHWIDGGFHQSRQPRPPVPPPSPGRARGRIRFDAARRRARDLRPPQWHGVRGGPGPAGVAHEAQPHSAPAADIPVWDGTPFDAGYAIDVLHLPPVGRVS